MKNFFDRYFIKAMGAMAQGLFASLIIGTILNQLATIPHLEFLTKFTAQIGASSPVIGSAIGVAIAFSLGAKALVLFTSAVTGALGYALGGPIGAYIAAVIGAEIGSLIAGKTKLDIILTPALTILSGGAAGIFVGPYINQFMNWLGSFINEATEYAPIPMGIVIAVVVGLALTAPISSAAICISIGISGIAAGAACVGCCCQMVGFAVASFRDNGVGGSISQGVGTSMLQFPNILKRPQIWLAPTLASAILGPISTALLGMTNTKVGAGMGTSGFVGQFGAFEAMGASVETCILVLLMHFILPALLTLGFDLCFRKLGWIKPGYMKLAQ
ncbi:MAG: PTS sugar transporter subunit IIC [Clostridia bacterium]|nr:PTS sugar transporter subunit IIC [Clostridia bacterium]